MNRKFEKLSSEEIIMRGFYSELDRIVEKQGISTDAFTKKASIRYALEDLILMSLLRRRHRRAEQKRMNQRRV